MSPDQSQTPTPRRHRVMRCPPISSYNGIITTPLVARVSVAVDRPCRAAHPNKATVDARLARKMAVRLSDARGLGAVLNQTLQGPAGRQHRAENVHCTSRLPPWLDEPRPYSNL